MRLALALTLASTLAHAQPAEALLDDLEDMAKSSTFGIEAELRVAELTRATYPAIARRFALAATRRNEGGLAYYKAMRILADLDLQTAITSATESNDPLLAYRALTESVMDDRMLFLDLLKSAHDQEAYGVPSVHAAIQKWRSDEIFIKDLSAALVNGLPEDLGPEEAIYLFEALREIGPESIDRKLLERAITAVARTMMQPGQNLPEYRKPTVFRIKGQMVTTQTLPEAALLRALAFVTALDDSDFLSPALKRLPWMPALLGLKLIDLQEALRPVETLAAPLPPPSPRPHPQLEALLDQARQSAFEQSKTTMFGKLLEDVDDAARIEAIARLYDASLSWPKGVEREDVGRKYVSEIERLGRIDSPVGHRLRDSGDLVNRLDTVAAQLGRDPATWPARLKSRSLLLRRFVHRVEQSVGVR